MTEWKRFLATRRGVLLTLPGAALWSIPIGIFGWEWLRANIAGVTSINVAYKVAAVGAMILAPVSIVCSMIAILRFIDNRDQVPPGLGFLLTIFNLFTVFVTVSLTLVLVPVLLSQ